MVTVLMIIAAALIGIPIAVMVAWQLIKLFFAILSDLAGLVFAFIVIAIITLIVIVL